MAASWSTACSRARRSTSSWSARPMTACAIEPLYAARADAMPARRPRAGGALADHGSGSIIPIRRRPTRRRCTISKTAPTGLVAGLSPARSARMATASTLGGDASRACSTACYLDAGIADRISSSPARPRTRRRMSRRWSKQRGLDPAAVDHPLRLRSDRRMAAGRRQPDAVGRSWRRCLRGMSRTSRRKAFAGRSRSPTARVIHNAGGSEAQELAYALAVAVAYLRALEAGGIALDAARRHDLLPACGRRRPVPDHREIPRACENCGRASRRPAGSRRSRPSSPPRPRGG